MHLSALDAFSRAALAARAAASSSATSSLPSVSCRGAIGSCKRINRSHAHTDREQHPRHRHTHTHDTNNTPNPQTNTPHKHLTTLEGGAMAASATSHAGVGGRAEVSVGGRVA